MTVADRLRAIVDALPEGSAVTLPANVVRSWLSEEPSPTPAAPALELPSSWRERLWTCPENTTLGVRELTEALGRSPDWVYRAVSAKRSAARDRHPLPCKKLDGVLTFEAGAIRRWLKSSAAIVNAEPPTLRRVV